MHTYQLTQQLPKEERYGLLQQMRRAAVSVAANITEGHQRRSKHEFLQFLSIAHGSLDELKYYYLLTKDLGYLDSSKPEAAILVEEVGKMLNGLKVHVTREVRHG